MPDGYMLDRATVDTLQRVFTKVFGYAPRTGQSNSNHDIFTLYNVRLDEVEGSISDSAEIVGYKGEIVITDYDNKAWIGLDIKFDPDSTREQDIKEFIYERNGREDAVGKIVSGSFRGSSTDEQPSIWSFDLGAGEKQIARITYGDGPVYTVQPLDGNLAAQGDAFEATCLAGRKHLDINEIVEILDIDGTKCFEWCDPVVYNAGGDSSPPGDNDNGNFDCLYDGLGTNNGILKNYDATDGKIKFRTLIAKGQDTSGSASDPANSAMGLKITKVSKFVDQISIVGKDGEPFVPSTTPHIDENGDPVGCDYSLDFNKDNRQLTLSFIADNGVEIPCTDAIIPCCPHEDDDDGGGTSTTDDNSSEDPSEEDTSRDEDTYDDPDNPDKPYKRTDECSKPRLTATLRNNLCYPLANGDVMADLQWQLGNQSIRDLVIDSVIVEYKNVVYPPGTVDITDSKKSLVFRGDVDPFGQPGKYKVYIEASLPCDNTSFDNQSSDTVLITVLSCDEGCDDPEEIDDSDTGGGSCDVATSEIWFDGSYLFNTLYPLNNPNAATESVFVNVSLDLRHGSPRRSNESTDIGPTVYSYAYHSLFNRTIEFKNPTQSKSYTFDVKPTSTRNNRAYLGKLTVVYTGAMSPRRASISYKHNGFIWSLDALGAIDGATVDKSYVNSSRGDGTMSVSLDIQAIAPEHDGNLYIGQCSVSNNCEDNVTGYTYTLAGGGDNTLFDMKDNGALYLKQDTDSAAKALLNPNDYNIQMTATHESVPAQTVTAQALDLFPEEAIAGIGIDNDIINGEAGGAVGRLGMVAAGGGEIFGRGANVELFSHNADGTAVDKDYWKVRDEEDGTISLMKNVALPPGTYTVGIKAINTANEFLGTETYQELNIIIDDDAAQYDKPEILGIV